MVYRFAIEKAERRRVGGQGSEPASIYDKLGRKAEEAMRHGRTSSQQQQQREHERIASVLLQFISNDGCQES